MRAASLVAVLCAGLAGCKTPSGDGCHMCQHAKAPAPPIVVDMPAMQAPPAAFNAAMMAPAAAAAPVTGGGMDLGIHFDCIKIPIPFPRLMAVPRPAQVTIPIAPAGYAAPMPVAMQPPCMSMPAGCGQGAGLQQIMAQLTPQQQQAFLQALASQPNAAAAAPAAAPRQIDQQLDDLMKACEELKQAKQERERAWRKAKGDESDK